VVIPLQPLGETLASLPGMLNAPPAQTTSLGSGTGPGAGSGRGPGLGEGEGPGLGPGIGGNLGGGLAGTGDGVVPPVPVHMERPRYSLDAMRARVEGVVIVACVVRTNGRCSDIHVTRSLDPRFGLDDEAKRAAALWRFRPGQRRGEAVPVAVTIELTFSVR